MTEPTRESMAEAFERVLVELGLDPVQCREGEHWWRFYPDELRFQGGIHERDFRVIGSLCELDAEVDLDTLYADMQARNDGLSSPARFVEEDNYLHVRAAAPFAGLTQARMREMIDACMTLARSSDASSLRSRYRSW